VEKTKNRALWGLMILVAFFFFILIFFALMTVQAFKDEASLLGSAKGKGEIAVIEINGPIMKAKDIVALIHEAEEDSSIKAVIARINSPGGVVGPTQEIYEEIVRLNKLYDSSKGEEGKPVFASFGSMAASGGYYIGAASRKIYASSGTLTGSIGVIMNFTNLQKLYEFIKIKPTPIKSGRYKDIGSPHRPMTKEEKSILSGTMKDVHKQFVEDILKMRKGKIKGDIWELAQGQIFSGREALKNGLVDEIAGLWEAGRKIHKDLELKKKFKLRFLKKKKRGGSLLDYIDMLEETSSNIKEAMQSVVFPKILAMP